MIDIRQATAEDAAPLAQLAERTFRDAFAKSNNPEDMDLHCRSSYGPSVQAAEIRDPNRTTIVCDVGGQLVGYGQLRRDRAPPCVAGRAPVEIQRIYVDASWHGKGVAQALMAALLDAALAGGADVVWLGVWERNPRALAFYSKGGFTQVGSHVFLVGKDPQKDWILAKDIGGRGSAIATPRVPL